MKSYQLSNLKLNKLNFRAEWCRVLAIMALLLFSIAGSVIYAGAKSDVKIFLPAVVKTFNQFMLEVEPNSPFETPNILSSSMAFRGFANDDADYVLIDHFPSGPFMVSLENPAIEAQLDVFSSDKQKVDNLYIYKPPYILSRPLLNAGQYYIRVHTPDISINPLHQYNLSVVFMSYQPYAAWPLNGATLIPLNAILRWGGVDSRAEAVTYDVLLEAGDSTPDIIVADSLTVSSFNPGGLAEGSTYYWQVVARDARTGITKKGPVWSFTTNHLPAAPSNPSPASGTTGTALNTGLSWTGSDPDGQSLTYDVYFDTANPPTALVAANQSGTGYTPGALALNTTYYWKVVAEDTSGDTAESPVWHFTTGNVPGSFSKITPADGSTEVSVSPTLTWQAAGGATSYSYCFDTTIDTACSPWVNTVATSASLSGLSVNTTYYWQVRANNSFGPVYANNDTQWYFTTEAKPGAFSKNQPANGSVDVYLSPVLSWNASARASFYEYCFDTTDDNNCSSWVSISATSTTLSGLSENTTYYWQVKAVNAYGPTHANGENAHWSFKTGKLSGAFNKSIPVDDSIGQTLSPILSWTPSSDSQKYRYCYDTTDDNACSAWVDTNSTTVSLSGLSQYTTYYWQVQSVNSMGFTYANGSSTAYWNFTTGGAPLSFERSSPAYGSSGVSTTITLAWESSVNATGYEYCYDNTNDNDCDSWVGISGTTATISGLSQHTTYYWHVRAINGFGTMHAGGSSTIFWNFTTGGVPSSFIKVLPGSGIKDGALTQELIWSSSTWATYYEYCIDTTNDNVCTEWIDTGATTSIMIDSPFSINTTYYWQVRAINAFGATYANGSSTDYWNLTTGNMILIPEGIFFRGCDAAHNLGEQCLSDQLPLATLNIDTFYIDKYEVTNAQYEQCVLAGICSVPTDTVYYSDPSYANYPVVYVDWNKASTYCSWTGKRLPTEAEWEKAARGNLDTRAFPWGDTMGDNTCGSCSVKPVNAFPLDASIYGVLNLAGNVSEWIADWYDPSYYTTAPSNNPPGPILTENKVYRGGNFVQSQYPGGYFHVARRGSTNPTYAAHNLGFRCGASNNP